MEWGTTVSLDWGDTQRITYGHCWTPAWDGFDQIEESADACSLALRDAKDYAAKVGAELLPGPPKHVPPDEITRTSYFVWPLAVVR